MTGPVLTHPEHNDLPNVINLRSAGVRDDDEIEALQGDEKASQRDKLLVVADRAEFWRSHEGMTYATIRRDDHREHHRVRSPGFREWLIVEAGKVFPIRIAGKERQGTFGKNAIEDALTACEAQAAASGDVRSVSLRVGAAGQAMYLDLGDAAWSAIEIDSKGWREVSAAGSPIIRTRRSNAIIKPVAGGSFEKLRHLLPLHDENDFRLVVLWLLGAIRPKGPYPILALSGEQGTGKSFTAKVIRRLVDPCGDNIMQPPREDRDLISAAKSNHVLAFDNLSNMPADLADSLCRLATGGDIGGRALYTDDESAAFAAQRPIIINGIPDLVTRGDLASRAIFVRLVTMKNRRTEADLETEFRAIAGEVLGGLLDALAGAMKYLPTATLPPDSQNFRMADFALMAIAAEKALGWREGSVAEAIRNNVRGATAMMVDLDPVAIAVRALIEDMGEFEGLVSTLFARINEHTDLESKRAPGWPRSAAKFGEHLRRLAPALRQNEIDISDRHSNRGTLIRIVRKVSSDSSRLPLSLLGEEERNHRDEREVNKLGNLPSLLSPNGRNGANPPKTGGVTSDSSDGSDSSAVTAKGQEALRAAGKSDSSDSRIRREFTRPAGSEEIPL